MSSKRIEDIKNKITLGYGLEDLQKQYPITQSLFLRLGGKNPSRKVKINHPLIKEIVEEGVIPEDCSFLDTDVIVGMLLGDGNIYKSLNAPQVCSFSFGHSVNQTSYVKLKYEILKPFVKRIRLYRNPSGYYSLHVSLKSLKIFCDYHHIFYTANKKGKSNPRKYVFNKRIVDLIDDRVFAFWVMDDGKKYGSGKFSFTITIGKQPYYTYKDFSEFVGWISEKLGFNLRPREEKISYEITPVLGHAEEIFNRLKSHIWPHFFYKFGVNMLECGSEYEKYSWFSEWREKHASLCNLQP